MKIIRRYLFTCLFLILSAISLLGWWHSSKVWMAWVAETPYGLFKVQSESSMFGFVGQLMQHEQRWAAYSTPDEITGDRMRCIAQMPKFKIDGGMFFILPYWQLLFLLLTGATIVFLLERRRVTRAHP